MYLINSNNKYLNHIVYIYEDWPIFTIHGKLIYTVNITHKFLNYYKRGVNVAAKVYEPALTSFKEIVTDEFTL